MNIIPPDALWLYVENQVHKLLSSLPPEWPAEPLELVIEQASRKAVIRVEYHAPRRFVEPRPETKPTEPSLQRQSPCARVVLDIVRAECQRLGRRLTGAEIWQAFQNAGHKWSRTTVNLGLADLVASGLLVNERDRRGYGPPE